MYGIPGGLEPLRQLVGAMRKQKLGNGFDAGPRPGPATKPVFDYLAGVGWPVICYLGCAEMQVEGGQCVMGAENEAALAATISDQRLDRLAREALPIQVSGDPIEYEENRVTNGWVVELINNAGATKKPDQPAEIDLSAIARVLLQPRIRCPLAREWVSNRSFPNPDRYQVEVGPGQSEFVEFICAAEGSNRGSPR